MPDRTILLEIGADDAVGRMGGERDRIEREEDDFHARAARAYRQLAEREPGRFVIVDGTASSDVLAEEIYGALEHLTR
jgi:dTMP kinase